MSDYGKYSKDELITILKKVRTTLNNGIKNADIRSDEEEQVYPGTKYPFMAGMLTASIEIALALVPEDDVNYEISVSGAKKEEPHRSFPCSPSEYNII